MIKKIRERWEKEYIYAVFLNYVKNHSEESSICRGNHFGKDTGISNNKAILAELIKRGYLKREKSVSIASTTKGRKILSEGTILLTERGKLFLDKRKDLVMFFDFATPYADILEYQTVKGHMRGKCNFETVMTKLLMNKAKKARREEDYINVKNLLFESGEIYREAGDEGAAIYSYLVSLYFSVSGLEYYNYFQEYIGRNISVKELMDSYEGIHIEPKLIEGIARTKNGYRDYMINHIYVNNNINLTFCGQNSFKKLVMSILNDRFSYVEWQKYFLATFKKIIATADKYRKE